MLAQRAMKASLRAGLVLEIEFVQHPLTHLGEDPASVQRRERGAHRCEQRVKEGEVLAGRSARARGAAP